MRSNHRLLIGILAFGALCAGLISALWFEQGARQAGLAQTLPEYRPDFQLLDTEGNMRRISEWDGQIVVLNFWATWCPPCRKEMPEFVQLQTQWQSKGVQFLGVAIDELPAVQTFLDQELAVNYPILMAGVSGVALAQAYGSSVGALPYTVIINRQGRPVFSHAGALEMAELDRVVTPLFQDK